MEKLFEVLVPIVIFVIVGIFKYLESRQVPPGEVDDSEIEERRRRAREEIRRMIAERGGQAPAEVEEEEREYDPFRSEREQREERPQPQPQARREYQPMPTGQVRDFESELAAKRREAAETRARAKEAAAATREKIGKAIQVSKPRSVYTLSAIDAPDIGDEVRALLDDPIAARKAIVLMEVLGTPIGQRVNGQIKRSWE